MDGDLAIKMKLALKHLKPLNIKGVIQGDFLFAKKDLEKKKIDGELYLTFHPNTIVYAVPFNSESAKTINKSKIGVVWHTTYTGTSFENMKASYGVKNPPNSTNVWGQDAMLTDASAATMSETETKEVTSYLSTAGFLFNKIAGDTLRELERNPELARLIEQYNNTFVHFQANTVTDGNNIYRIGMSQHYNGNYTDFKNPKFTEIRVKELDDESDMERDLGYYIVDTTALMQDLRKLKTIERVS